MFKHGSKLIIKDNIPDHEGFEAGEIVICMGAMSDSTTIVEDKYSSVYELDNIYLKEDNELPIVKKPLVDITSVSTITFFKNGRIVLYGNRAHQAFSKIQSAYFETFRESKTQRIRKINCEGTCIEFTPYDKLSDCLKDITNRDVLMLHEDAE
jgi:hypothetical protein